MLFSRGNKILLKTILILLVGSSSTIASTDDNDVIDPKAQQVGGQPSVMIDSETQVASGLKTILVSLVQHQAEFESVGKVISIQPLLALRERYLVAQAELNGAKARLKQAGQNLKRQQELFRHGIAAKRSLQEQEVLGSTDQALVEASQIRLLSVANETRLLWGKELAEWALSDKAGKLKELLLGQQQLLQITLPANKQLPSQIDKLFVEPTGQRSKATPATLISRSTQVDNTMQGESYFFKVNGEGLSVGMKITVWIPEPTLGQSGVIVPESALIWYMDQVYVYIKVAKDTFSRRLIKEFSLVRDGYFVKDDITAGEEVVTTGGQMLLSEELRGQIPDED
ncbi:MAG: efflux RND transporter periplasmic adaptor subunit [Methyloglobulus sp.]